MVDPPENEAWAGYAELCLFLGNEHEYRAAGTALLAIADKTKHPRAYPHFVVVKCLALCRLNKPTEALELLRTVPAELPGPVQHLVRALAYHHKGQPVEARKELAAGIALFNWRMETAVDQDRRTHHILRREAERLILPDLPAFLEEKCQPQDNWERLALIGACQSGNRLELAAKLYADALAADPKLADSLQAHHRYNAACLAVAAGCQRDEGQDHVHWRGQALTWLREETTAFKKAYATQPQQIHNEFSHWLTDNDPASLREPARLAKLPEEERKPWTEFWSEVQATLRSVSPSK